MQIETGTYTGDGVSGLAIAGIGFAPDVVWALRDTTNEGAWKTKDHASTDAQRMEATAIETDLILSLDSDGFTVGDSAETNVNTEKFHYAALQMATADSKIGTYIGDGGDPRSIIGVGFQPDLVITAGEAGTQERMIWRTSDVTGDESRSFFDMSNLHSDKIQALEDDGFQLGSSVNVNQSGIKYYYLAIKNITGQFKVVKYTGDGNDNRSITGVGFKPDFAVVKSNDTSADTDPAVFRSTGHSGDEATPWSSQVKAADLIQAFAADGFQVGTTDMVNQNTKEFICFCFRRTFNKPSQALFI